MVACHVHRGSSYIAKDVAYTLQGAGGIANLLFGDASPSGRLPVSFVFNNYTEQIEMTDMRMSAWPGEACFVAAECRSERGTGPAGGRAT
jgi:hypothetical protein